MSYVAEPYSQFVDDLLTSLTGGATRERFVFIPEDAPFQLSPAGPIVKSTVRVFGQSGGAFARFRIDLDFTLTSDNVIEWKKRRDGTQAADASWPDAGTPFFVNYEHTGAQGAAPVLTDRNPGSVVRVLAESFAREYAVLSRQLEAVYRAGFLDTAAGRDLEQMVALVGLKRRDSTYATGSVVFSRATPAAADIFLAAGTRLSTTDSPVAVFETSEDRTLTRGSLSVEVPIRAVASAGAGVVAPQTIQAIHRPILGIESVTNGQGTRLIGNDETDEALRLRARRALEGAGKATTGAIVSALTTLPAIQENDLVLSEDPLTRPGIISLTVAAQLSDDDVARVVDLVEQSRPAGIRVIHNLDALIPPGPLEPGLNSFDDSEPPADAVVTSSQTFVPIAIEAVVIPASSTLTAHERDVLKNAAEDALRAVVSNAGIGTIVVYNRLVAAVMAIEGVQDVALELYGAGEAPSTRRNFVPKPTQRPTVDVKHGGSLNVELGGQLVAVDMTIKLTLKNAGPLGDKKTDLEDARVQAAGQFRIAARSMTELSAGAFRGAVSSANFTVDTVTFSIEYVQSGLRINQQFSAADAPLKLSPLQKPWIRTVKLDPLSA